MSFFPLKNSFSLFVLTLLAVRYPFISSAASLHGLYPSPPRLTSLPPPALCKCSTAPCSIPFVQELAASTFCAIKCSQLNSGLLGSWKFDEMPLLEQNVYDSFLEFPFI